MGLKKGQTNNRKGRPKGSENKVNKPIRECITSLVEKNMDKFQDVYDSLEPKMKMKVLIDLIGLVLPKYAPIPFPNEADERNGNSNKTWFERLREGLDEVASD
jgi:hypothetical protein